MADSETQSFVRAVLRELGYIDEDASIRWREASRAPWPEAGACDVDVGDRRLRLSFRVEHCRSPTDLVDFIGLDDRPQPHTELVIVYLNARRTRTEPVPERFVLARQWRSVTHLYWNEAHPWDSGPPPTEPPPATTALAEGGRRLAGIGPRSPRFSIVTIVFNGATHIEQTIQSVLHGKYADELDDVEYVVLDGASTDETLNVVSRYGEYIDYWRSEPDNGIYDALNKAIDLCHGEFIGAIHSNDLYHPGWLGAVRSTIDRHPADEFFFGKVLYVNQRRSWVRGSPIATTRQVVMFGYFNHPTCFIKRDAYERLGKYDQRYSIAGDYDLGIRFWKSGIRFRFIDATISCFRLGGASSDLYSNQWQRHRARVANGENPFYSLAILTMVLANYYLKLPLRLLRR